MAQAHEIDRLAEATGGKLHWNDAGMDARETGWESFTLGKRVEVRTQANAWVKGTVVETPLINDRALVVEADDVVHDNLSHRGGKGLTIPVIHNTKRGILSNIREVDEEPRHVDIPVPQLKELEDKGAEMLKIMEVAVEASEERLRIAAHEDDDSANLNYNGGRFLKFDGKRVGRDVEMYDFMGRSVLGWEQVLAMFLGEVLSPVKGQLPESYSAAASKLEELGEKVYEGDTLDQWRQLFQEDSHQK